MTHLSIQQGDITRLAHDAIVNAADELMLGGGGVDGAIHEAAGPQLLEACRNFPTVSNNIRCPTGQVRLTPAFKLPSRFVIHTVGPVWRGGDHREPELLADCYRNSLWLAECAGVRSIAFPAISCGVYGFPLKLASEISVQTIGERVAAGTSLERVDLVAFDTAAYEHWHAALLRFRGEPVE